MQLADAVTPREDVLAGELSDDVFAASLVGVASGKAAAPYGNPAEFFAATHPAAGLRILLNEALGRLTGNKRDASPVIRLETSLGGGKTHNLIGLYHGARARVPAESLSEFMDPANAPTEPVEALAILVGSEVGATSFPEIDSVRPQTCWGYLALQLGGKQGYELVRGDDEQRTAPGADAIKRLLGDRPTLILIDEISRYLATASGVQVGRDTLADQTVSFLMALLEAVSEVPRACVVLTTTERTDPFGVDTEQVLDKLGQLEQLVGRRALTLRPSEERDLAAILARRLFADIDRTGASEIGRAYEQALHEAFQRGLDVPEQWLETGAFSAQVEESYPFHPLLLRVLDKRLSTIPHFQRARGSLRLLAKALRRLWQQLGDDWLLHPHHLDLSDRAVAEELSSNLDRPRYEPVIRADIRSAGGGQPSNAELIAEEMQSDAPVRLATTVYLHSLTNETPGVPAGEVLSAALTPNDDPGLLSKALSRLDGHCWYLHTDEGGYRFSTEWSLAKRVQDMESRIPRSKVSQEATSIYRDQFRDTALKVKRTWEDLHIPDRAEDAYLVLLHWDEEQVDGPDEAAPQKVRELWEHTPAGGNRTHRNRLVFLLPNREGHTTMRQAVRRHLALRELAAQDLSDLTTERRREVKERAEQSKAEARVAVCNHVNVLYVPQGVSEGVDLAPVQMDQLNTSNLRSNQTEAVLERLSAMEKTLVHDDKPLDPAYVRSKLGALAREPMPTAELIRFFARRADLKLVLDHDKLRDLVAHGVQRGVWDYYDPELGDRGWATQERPWVSPRIDEATLIYPPGSAPAPPESTLKDDLVVTPPASPPGDGDTTQEARGQDRRFPAKGSAPHALATALQQAWEAGWPAVERLTITTELSGEGTKTQLAKLLAMAPRGVGASAHHELETTVELPGQEANALEINFRGQRDELDVLRYSLDHLLGKHQAWLRATVQLTFDEPVTLDGEVIDQLTQQTRDAGPDRCELEVHAGGKQ